ncbi:MAG: hypothetical protein PHC28_14980 [Flavobacterium sp.]|uniref:hypothetical protein n=1 Tax=Flavobacterium sp. TaxID=239 RepID=UPI002611166C|nr:hypothetical protein [Flavobacterium sp.]MDD5151757.1 hypothetical protein [Flavobacterium sp.]
MIDNNFIKKLDKTKQYHLYDDDIHTGETIEFIIDYLKNSGIDISNYFSMNYATTEILDNRDFIVFWENNGLVIDDDGTRVPYIYPFVDPYIRCSIINPLEFSIDIWKQNIKICERHNKKLVDTEQRYFYNKLGFKDNQYCWEICKFYYDFLIGIK